MCSTWATQLMEMSLLNALCETCSRRRVLQPDVERNPREVIMWHDYLNGMTRLVKLH